MNLNDKYFKLLTTLKLIDEFDYENFVSSLEVKITRSKSLNKLNLKIYIKNLNNFEFIINLQKKINLITDKSINIFLIFDLDLNFINNLFNAIIFYFKNHINLNNKKEIIRIIEKRKGFFNKETNEFIIYFFNEKEDQILNEFGLENFEKSLNYFNISNIKISFKLSNIKKEFDVINQKNKIEFENKKRNLINQTQTNQNLNKFENRKKIIESIIKIKEINQSHINSICIVQGEIFKIDVIETKNNFKIYKFFITDYSDSILIKYFINKNNDLKNNIDIFKLGSWIKAKISIVIDSFENNDITGIAKEFFLETKPEIYQKTDDFLKKRVELIVHTNMSAYEGIASPKKIFDHLKKLNHKVFAVTDKYNCQSFPEVYNISKKFSDIKILYGVQLNIFEKHIKIVDNLKNININNSEFVIFDIETTGLSFHYCKIIEIAGIKYKNGIEIDKLSFFVNPECEIPEKIQAITRITNENVKNGLNEKDALIKFKNFIADSVLIAHNGIKFDLPFINARLEANKIEKINNAIIDTMQLSRAINDMNSHRLASVCKKFKINYDEEKAHRALVDCDFLLKVWKNFEEIINNKNIKTLKQLDDSFQNDLLRSKNKGSLVTIYCKKQESIKYLYELISKSLTKNFLKEPRIYKSDFKDLYDHFLITNSPTEGDIIEYALFHSDYELEMLIKNNYDFITISPISCFLHNIIREEYYEDWIKNSIIKIINLAKKYKKIVVASGDCYYLNKEDQDFLKVYVNSKLVGGKPHRLFSFKNKNDILPDLFFRTTKEMIDEFKFLNDKSLIEDIVINNTNKIADLIENEIKPIKEKLHSPKIESSNENLKIEIYKKAYEIYGQNINEFVKSRIQHELDSVINNGYSVVYWFSHLLTKKSLEDGFLVGSRGSVGSSFIAWLLKISEVNPLPAHFICKNCKYFEFIKNCESGFDLNPINCKNCNELLTSDGHNIPFETFMGFEGDKVPDIDLNFSAIYQSKAHDYIREMFGSNKVFRAGTISTVAEKTAYGHVKEYLEKTNQTNFKQAEIYRLAINCENVKRTTGQHPGGIIVVPDENDICDFTPFNYPADDFSQDWYTTHFAFEHLHDSLLKFDILGHDNPTVLKMLSETTNVNPLLIPNYDDKVIKLFNEIDVLDIKDEEVKKLLKIGTSGIPEFGTNFVKEMLLLTRPKIFSDLIRISGLSHGTSVWTDNAKDLIQENICDISQVISCRDDIMVFLEKNKIEPKMAFKIMEDVRKGKGLKQEYIDILKKHKIAEWYINSCNKIKYLFPKAHATAYVIMAWKIAWFKMYYPLHFYASYFTIRTDVFDIKTAIKGKAEIFSKLINIKKRLEDPKTKKEVKKKEQDLILVYELLLEMMARGFNIDNISLTESMATDFIIKTNKIIPPFNMIDGLGEAVANSIVSARNQKPFTSKHDLKSRTKLSIAHMKILEELNVLDSLQEDDQTNLFN